MSKKIKISVIGLGYVGLPLALKFSEKFETVGFDLNKERVNSLKKNDDRNNEINKKKLLEFKNILYTSNVKDLEYTNFFIITVPTPVNKSNKPNLNPVLKANKLISNFLNKDSIIVYESTVYPGCTEEIFAKNLEKLTKLKFNKDFYVGYSPERINPGDKHHQIEDIVKLISASTKDSLRKIKYIYSKIINKIELVDSIKLAEASKVIENTQRDVNVALMNEFYNIFERENLDFKKILEASNTKWNFLNFKPGLVGGHCISVDPYYLIEYAKKNRISSKIIEYSRLTNNNMYKLPLKKIRNFKNFRSKKLKILICGLSFKDDVNDMRNSQSIKIIKKLSNMEYEIHTYDPLIKYVEEKILFKHIKRPYKKFYDVVLVLRSHKIFKTNKRLIINSKKKSGIFLDYSFGLLEKNICHGSF